MSGWSCSGGGSCFFVVLFCFAEVAKRPFIKLAQFGGCFCLFSGILSGRGRGVPHLKTGMSARVAVSPPSSTKKIDINSGWGCCVVVRVGLVGEGFDIKSN